MAIATVSNNIASQIEHIRPELENLTYLSSKLWKFLKVRTDVKPVSNRPARIPFEVLQGGKFRTTNFDGGDLGLGSGLQETFGSLSCVSFVQASQYTALADWATDGDSKAIANYVEKVNSEAAKTIAGCLDATVQGDGSNTLDSVVNLTAPNGLIVNNVNFFMDNQDIDVWSALSGTFRGTVTIESIDSSTTTIWLTGPYPAGTAAGDLLLVNGSAGVANTGLQGLRSYQVAGNTGTYMGVSRSAYPGKFSTPNVNLNGGSLTPASVRLLEAQMELAMGENEDDGGLVAHLNVDMRAAWENNALLVQSIIYNEMKGDSSADMLKKNAPATIAGIKMLVNTRARPGYIDFLNLKHWFRIETKPMDYYEVGGQTIFPTYGDSGGISTSMVFYMVLMTQVGNGQPRKGAYMNNVAIPSGYFGH